ncbi:MAG: DUF4399 domain-containing protein [Chloroflexi bacterium]|nr:DUF4399 domain-containing protein [Chloroflexota bacterium]
MTKTIAHYLKILLPLVLALTLIISGCAKAPSAPPSAPPTAPTTPAPPSTPTTPVLPPTLKIIQPAAGATLSPGSIHVMVEIGNFKLVPPGGTPAAGEGHLHFYKDVDIPTTPGQPTFSAPGTYKATPNTTATWDNVAPGTHTFGVQLVNNNHTPLSPPVTAKVTVTVTAPATTPAPTTPSVKITQPANGSNLPAGNIQVTAVVSNFEIVPPGGANAPGKGHLHFYMDVNVPTTPGQPAVTAAGTYKATPNTTVTWENVAAGSHVLHVQLVNSDHTPLSPPVTAQVTVNVTAPVTTPPPTTPSVKIIQPAVGATVPAGSVQISVEVTNFELVAPGGANAPGKGHLHYYMDVDIPTAAGQPTFTAAGTYKASPNTTVTWDNVTPGTHTFGVQLVNSNHTPLDPPVIVQIIVTVTVGGSTPTPPDTGGGSYGY